MSASEALATIIDLRCWYVSCGGAAGPTFSLALGRQIPREFKLQNSAHEEIFQENEGESAVYVWSTWRLDDSTGPICSSDNPIELITYSLNRLRGESVAGFHLSSPVGDLTIRFSNGLSLNIFCDHVGDAATFQGNWECVTRTEVVAVGTSGIVEVSLRT